MPIYDLLMIVAGIVSLGLSNWWSRALPPKHTRRTSKQIKSDAVWSGAAMLLLGAADYASVLAGYGSFIGRLLRIPS